MDKWIIIHPTHLLPNPFMTQPAHLPPLLISDKALPNGQGADCGLPGEKKCRMLRRHVLYWDYG